MSKKFDCVEMKHNGAEKVQKILKGMSRKEELAYWQKKYEELKAKKRSLS